MTNAASKRSLDPFSNVVTRDPKKMEITRTMMPANTPCETPHCKGTYLADPYGEVRCTQCSKGVVVNIVEREG